MTSKDEQNIAQAYVEKKTRISYEELKERLTGIHIFEHQVFLMLTYSVLGRVGEIVKGDYNYNPPIASNQILTKELPATKEMPNGKRLLTILLLTEKTDKFRRVPVNRDKEAWLTEPILDYAKFREGKPMFPYSVRWGQKVFEKYFGDKYNQHIHLLRGWRATHLRQGKVTGSIVDWGVIAKMGGWTEIKTPQRYYDSSISEDFEQFI